MLFIVTTRSRTVLYHNDIFVIELNDYLIDFLIKTPKDFSFGFIDLKKAKPDLKQYYNIITKYNNESMIPDQKDLPLNL